MLVPPPPSEENRTDLRRCDCRELGRGTKCVTKVIPSICVEIIQSLNICVQSRIIADAEAGISKHQLLLQAQADGTSKQNDYRGFWSATNHDQRSAAATRSMTTMEYKPVLPPRRGWTT